MPYPRKLKEYPRYVPSIPSSMLGTLFLYVPGALGYWLRYRYYKSRLRYLGKNVLIGIGMQVIYNPKVVSIDSYSHIDNYVIIEGFEKEVRIGKYVHISPFCVIQGGDEVSVGDYVGISAGCRVYSAGENYRGGKRMTPQVPDYQRNVVHGPVIIERDAFLGVNSIVLPGVKIGEGAVIGANSLVLNDIPPWTIAVGSPAKPIKERPRLSFDNS